MQYRYKQYIVNLNKVISYQKYPIVEAYNLNKRKNYAFKIINTSDKIDLKEFKNKLLTLVQVEQSLKIISVIQEKESLYIFSEIQNLNFRTILKNQNAKNIQNNENTVQLIQNLFLSYYELTKKSKCNLIVINPENIFFNAKKQKIVFNTTSIQYINYKNNQTNKDKLNYRYYSPELISLKPHEQKSIIWSLGIIAYEIYFKKYPFLLQNGFYAFTNKILKEQQITQIILSSFKKKINQQKIEKLIKKCLVYDVRNRWAISEIIQFILYKPDVFTNMFPDLQQKLSSINLQLLQKEINQLVVKQFSEDHMIEILEQAPTKIAFFKIFDSILKLICLNFFFRIKKTYEEVRKSIHNQQSYEKKFTQIYQKLYQKDYKQIQPEIYKQMVKIIEFQKFSGFKENFNIEKYGIDFIKKINMRYLKKYLNEKNQISNIISLLNKYEIYKILMNDMKIRI